MLVLHYPFLPNCLIGVIWVSFLLVQYSRDSLLYTVGQPITTFISTGQPNISPYTQRDSPSVFIRSTGQPNTSPGLTHHILHRHRADTLHIYLSSTYHQGQPITTYIYMGQPNTSPGLAHRILHRHWADPLHIYISSTYHQGQPTYHQLILGMTQQLNIYI